MKQCFYDAAATYPSLGNLEGVMLRSQAVTHLVNNQMVHSIQTKVWASCSVSRSRCIGLRVLASHMLGWDQQGNALACEVAPVITVMWAQTLCSGQNHMWAQLDSQVPPPQYSQNSWCMSLLFWLLASFFTSMAVEYYDSSLDIVQEHFSTCAALDSDLHNDFAIQWTCEL